MERSLAELELIVRNRICKVCTARTVDGECGLENPSVARCSGFSRRWPTPFNRSGSDDIQQYVDAIRRQVCTVCSDQAPDGTCETRQQVQCALDAYLLLVVDAIEEATGKTFDRDKMTGGAGAPARLAHRSHFEVNRRLP